MIQLVLVLSAFGLALVFALVLNGWRASVAEAQARKPAELVANGKAPSLALIIPVRNGEGTITELLQDLYAGSLPDTTVMVVDDGSTDSTAERVRSMLSRWPRLQLIPCNGTGKKAAITTGVHASDADWILVTDADARCGPERTQRIMQHMIGTGDDLVIMPVATDGEGLLGGLQENEQAALMMCAAGTALEGHPMLANGANLAFRRKAFLDVQGYSGDRHASGDDIFLVQRMLRAGKRVGYCADPGVIVRVRAEPTWSAFVQQRLRWAGKMRSLPWRSLAMPAIGLLLPWSFVAITFGIDWPRMVGSRFLMGALLLMGAWLIYLNAVTILVRDGQRFVGQRSSPLGAWLSYSAFALYAPVLAFASFFWKPEWKGRRIH